MIISPLDALPYIEKGKFLTGLSERELTAPEGIGFDLRIDELYRLAGGGGFLGKTHRNTVQTEEIKTAGGSKYTLEPGACYLATTIEKFNLPPGIAAIFHPRSTLFRSGVFAQNSSVPPGYKGSINVALNNATKENFMIEREARFIHVILVEVSGESNEYLGQWQGGRTSITKKEEQI